MPKISIIIPNYNGASYLCDCLNSVLGQEFQDWEAIIIDDGSTDKSRDIIKKYAKRDKRFIPIFQENRGASSARNAGLDIARGDYIAFLDSDDCYAKYGISNLLKIAESHDADLVAGLAMLVPNKFKYAKANHNLVDPGKARLLISQYLQDYLTTISWGEEYKWVWIWRQLYRRDLLKGKRFVDGLNMGDDICFMLDVLYSVKKFAQINLLVTYHRRNPDSLSEKEFGHSKFIWFPRVLKYIKENSMDKYPKFFKDFFYSGFLSYFYLDTVANSKKFNKYKREAANTLKRAWIENNFPKKFIKWRYRVIIWFFIHAYAD